MLQRTDMCVDGEAVQWTRSKPHVGDRGAALAKQSAALEGDTRTLPQRGSIRPFMLLPSTCPNECVSCRRRSTSCTSLQLHCLYIVYSCWRQKVLPHARTASSSLTLPLLHFLFLSRTRTSIIILSASLDLDRHKDAHRSAPPPPRGALYEPKHFASSNSN